MPISPKFLLDSGVFIRWRRQRQNPTTLLKPYILYERVYTCGVVKAEVLCETKFPGIKEETRLLFNTLINIDTTLKVWGETAELAWWLERLGKRIPRTDVIIAACAREAGIAIPTFDTDFAVVPGLTVHSELP